MNDRGLGATRAIRGIVFDAVGTLIEARPTVGTAYTEAAARQGVSLTLREVRARFSRAFRTDEDHELRGPGATDEATELRRWRRIVAEVLPEISDPARAFDELWEHFAEPSSWTVHEDALAALVAFESAGLRLRVASNFDARLRCVLRGHARLARFAESAIISSEVGYRKPHPAFFEAVCRNLDLGPDEVLCIGDDLENDVLGPLRAGLRAVLVAREDRPSAGDGVMVVQDIRELVDRVLDGRASGSDGGARTKER